MLRVTDVMADPAFTLSPTDSIKAAREAMARLHTKYLPVVSGLDEYLGILSEKDILRTAVSSFSDVDDQIRDQIESGIPVSEVMTLSTVTITARPSMTLGQAAALMQKHKCGCLPVVDNGRFRGMLTEYEFIGITLSLLDLPSPHEELCLAK